MWISVCRPTRAPPEERGPEPNSMGRGARPPLQVLKLTGNRVSKELSRSCNHDTLCHFTDSQTADTRRHGVPRQASMQLWSSPIPRVEGPNPNEQCRRALAQLPVPPRDHSEVTKRRMTRIHFQFYYLEMFLYHFAEWHALSSRAVFRSVATRAEGPDPNLWCRMCSANGFQRNFRIRVYTIYTYLQKCVVNIRCSNARGP